MNGEYSDSEHSVPGHVLRFEALLYLSLGVDALSAAFTDYSDTDVTAADRLTTAALLALSLWLVWLAARRRKRWARSILFGVFVLSTLVIVALFQRIGLTRELAIEILSQGLSAAGIYFSFTGNAREWFDGQPGGNRRS